jgi:hypothetical protein
MHMGLRLATPHELDAVRSALDEFRAHWESIGPVFPCSFEGTGADIDALDYLDYEGLKYPSSGQAGAALVWGNVVATQLPFRWFLDDELAGLVLRSQSCGLGLTIRPFGRIYESQRSAETQFDKYRWLLESVVLQALGLHLVEEQDRPRLLALLGGEDARVAQSLEYALGRLRELRGGPGP